MAEIADLTYNVVAFTEIMQMLWKRLNDHGKNWRHVYKALVLLEYLIKTGSEKVAQQCKENIFAIQTLKGNTDFVLYLFSSETLPYCLLSEMFDSPLIFTFIFIFSIIYVMLCM